MGSRPFVSDHDGPGNTAFYVFHETQNTDFMAVRVAVSAQGSHNQITPLAGNPTKVHKIPYLQETARSAAFAAAPVPLRTRSAVANAK